MYTHNEEVKITLILMSLYIYVVSVNVQCENSLIVTGLHVIRSLLSAKSAIQIHILCALQISIMHCLFIVKTVFIYHISFAPVHITLVTVRPALVLFQ